VIAPAVRIVPLPDDTELRMATQACVDYPPDIVVATTGVGFRGWLSAASALGLPLAAVLEKTRIVARGPKARGAIRAAGLTEVWSPESECSAEVLSWLLSGDLTGQRVAVQLHGEPQPMFIAALRESGADVVEVPVYQWTLPEDIAPLQRLVDQVLAGLVDAVTFTSAPAVTALLKVAPNPGAVIDAFRENVLAACVGPVCAALLEREGVPVVVPPRGRLGTLVRALTEELPRRAPCLQVAGTAMQLRGHAAVVDGEYRPLAPAPMAVLRALAANPGRVLSRTALLDALPRGADGHAVEMAVARLRAGLHDRRLVETVVKRGYRLRVE